MRGSLTAVPRSSKETPGKRKMFPVYQEYGGNALVPKFYLQRYGIGSPTGSVEPKIDASFQVPFVGKLQPDQMKGTRDALAILKARHGVFLQGRCGSGKTVVGTFLISKIPGGRTVIMVDQTEIAAQWAEQIRAHLPSATISFVMPMDSQKAICKKLNLPMSGRQNIDFDGRVVIVMAETLMRVPLAKPIDAVLLIVDEAHSFSAERFSATVYHFNFRYSVALTATERRSDGLEWIFQALLGTEMARLEGKRIQATVLALAAPSVKITKAEHRMYFCDQYKEVTSQWRCSQRCNPTAPCVFLRGDGTKIDYSSVWQRIAEDEQYNGWIVNLVSMLYRYGRHAVVFGKYKAHLKRLREETIKIGVPREHTALYFAGMDKEKSTTPQITFATYGKVQKAIDLPHKDAALFAMPISDAQQPMGRIERYLPGKIQTVLIEPVLANVEPLARIFWGHCSFYRKENYVVIRTDPQGADHWLAACHQDHQRATEPDPGEQGVRPGSPDVHQGG